MIELAFALCLALQDPDEEKIEQLIDQLAADYEDERVAARKELEKIGAAAESLLVRALKREDHRIKQGCLELLTAIKSTKAVERAAELFRGNEEGKLVKQAAFDYLRMAGKPAEEVLIEALDSAEAKWRRDALETLKEIKSEKCAAKVADLYNKEQDKAIKDLAFICLQNIGKPAQPFLLKLLESQDAKVREGAITGLQNIGATSDELFEPVSKLFVKETEASTLQKAYEFLKSAGEKADPVFLAGLASASEGVRLKSIEGLKERKLDAALEPLARLFENDASETVRNGARESLEKYGLKAEDAFVKALANGNAAVRLSAIESLGTIQSEKPFEKIAEVYRTDKDAKVHEAAFRYLERVGIRAEKELLAALKDESAEIRKRAIAALGRAKSEAAIAPLIDLMSDLKDEVRDAATESLVRIGEKAIDAVNASGMKQKAKDAINALYHRDAVELLLQKLVTKEGSTGFFEGQFAELDAYGQKHGRDKVLPALVKMATDGYKWRITEWKGEPFHNEKSLKELAIMACGVLGDKTTAAALREQIKDRKYQYGDEQYEEYVIALHRLGEKGFYDALMLKLTQEVETALKAEDKLPAFEQLFSLALMQNRVGEHKGALETYLRLAKVIEEFKKTKDCDLYGAGLYNVACLYALSGDKAKSVEYLERAVEGGFKDKDWIQMDKDLDGIRGEEAYKKLMGDPKKFEKIEPKP